MLHAFLSSLLFFWLIFAVVCNHFNGGTITWRPLNASATGTPVSIIITQTYFWSYSLMPCTLPMIASNQLMGNYLGVASDKLQCISNCVNGSVGYSSVSVISYCIGGSAAFGSSIGQRSDIVNLTSGDDFSVAYQKSFWRILATAASANWSLASHIKLTQRSDNGLYNNAPSSTMMSPREILLNQATVINIPVSDADDDDVRCRWANSSNGVDECGGICPPSSLPSGTVLYSNCTMVITGQVVYNWYAIAIMVEDFINPSSNTPLSSVPVQFLVQVVPSPSCPYIPTVVETPLTGTCKVAIINQTFTFQLIATSYCGSMVLIADILLQAFPGVTQGNLTQLNSTTFYKTISWIPTSTQLGYQTMCAMTVDTQDTQSSLYCFTFYVSTSTSCSCPNQPCSTTMTTTTTTTTSTSSTTKSTTSITTTTSTRSTTTSATFMTTTTSTRSTTTSATATTTTTSTRSTTTSATFMTTTTSTQSTRTSTTSTFISIISTTSMISTLTTSITVNMTATSTIPITNSTSSSESENGNLYKWVVIGSITGIPVLLALILAGCLCWHYCSPCGIGRINIADGEGLFEFYHFDFSTESKLNNEKDQYRINRIFSEDDNDSLVLQNTSNTTEYTTLDVNNRLAFRRRDEEQCFYDQHTNSIFESKSPSRSTRNNSAKEHRTIRPKPKRVTVISLPPSKSQSILDDQYTIPNYRLMAQTPDYEQKINDTHIKHVHWSHQRTKNESRLSQFDTIN